MTVFEQASCRGSRRVSSRLTIRGRLTVSYAGLVMGCGAVLIAIVYLYMRYVPTYALSDMAPTEPGATATAGEASSPDSVSTLNELLQDLLIASSIALAVLAVLSGTVGWLVAARIIKPLRTINAAATRAATGALDHRIGLHGPDDEVHRLAATFDRMLESLERSFESQRRFAANASHELRTPLSTTKTMIEVALADPNTDAAQLRSLIERIAEVNHDNIAIAEALLALAAAEATTVPRDPIDLTAVVARVINSRADEARRSHITIVTDVQPAMTTGDATLVRQAVDNMVRNALQHNLARGGSIHVRTWADDAHTYVVVANTGAPIPPDKTASLLEPFVRGIGRTARRGTGHGLGLAIVDAIARAHDGIVTLVARTEGGLTVTLALPVTPPRRQ
ncbi:sensor histidine kinase [Williamsia maris]|uniref:histidine kinase n=1 Tax=Williamsia maris TaxID=72806 RepID=A0ABT1HEW3_9NOCA|nr:HAMP domain-containing sensor histidine kinase [Williamsia maris]MCP2175530.1 two-component system, OmpR family, sensor histidine kinase VanS [Williamsia maris]